MTLRFTPMTKKELVEAINTNDKGDINSWDVSNITDMSNLFQNSQLNELIDNWDVSNVTNQKK